jgi:hypothetical protein
MKRHLGAVLATAGLLAACATGRQDLRDNSALIDEVMRPDPPGTPIPEGIELGLDAPPLAPPDTKTVWAPVAQAPEHIREIGSGRPWFYTGPLPFFPHACHPPAVRYHIKPTPGGTTPGLLP